MQITDSINEEPPLDSS